MTWTVFFPILVIPSIFGENISSIFLFKCKSGTIPSGFFDSFPTKRKVECFIFCAKTKKCFAATYSYDEQCFFHEKEVKSCTEPLKMAFKVYNKIAFSTCFNKGKYDIFTKMCNCDPGFYGKFCQHDACLPNPCKNFGICHRKRSEPHFQCLCIGGFSGLFCESEISLQITNEITHEDPVGFGKDFDYAFCNRGYFVYGVRLRVEHGGFDNTGVNNLELKCMRPYDNATGSNIKSGSENEGVWYGMSFCPLGMFMIGFQVRSVPYRGFLLDDNAVTDFKFKCKMFMNDDNVTIEIQPPGGLNNGNWYQSYSNCNENSAVCGVKTKIEIFASDHTGLNQLKFKCCKFFNQ